MLRGCKLLIRFFDCIKHARVDNSIGCAAKRKIRKSFQTKKSEQERHYPVHIGETIEILRVLYLI